MNTNRRNFLKGLASVAAAATPGLAGAAGDHELPDDAVGMLYDTTRCIGCKACVVACKEANGMPADTRQDDLYDMPMSLNDRTRNIIKLYKGDDQESFMKQQCLHCVDPGCVSACMIGSLQKREHGIVSWDASRCIGCRYCQLACPYEIPKFEWDDTRPQIIKCELCSHRIKDGGEPACCEVCPREAVIYGRRDELLAEAKRRLREHPGRYVDEVYGEHEAGGTQVLYLSHVPFEKLGLPRLGDQAVGKMSREIQHGIYKGFIAPVAVYGVLGAVMIRNRRQEEQKDQDPS